MPSAHTLPHPGVRTGTSRPAPDRDPVARISALYAPDTPAAQAALARAARSALAAAGIAARLGSYGPHVTVETPAPGGALVLVPLADLSDLSAELAVEDDSDPAVWHVLARDEAGRLLADPRPAYGCPSVLWAVRAGIDPACAVWLAAAARADAAVVRTLRWQVAA